MWSTYWSCKLTIAQIQTWPDFFPNMYMPGRWRVSSTLPFWVRDIQGNPGKVSTIFKQLEFYNILFKNFSTKSIAISLIFSFLCMPSPGHWQKVTLSLAFPSSNFRFSQWQTTNSLICYYRNIYHQLHYILFTYLHLLNDRKWHNIWLLIAQILDSLSDYRLIYHQLQYILFMYLHLLNDRKYHYLGLLLALILDSRSDIQLMVWPAIIGLSTIGFNIFSLCTFIYSLT